MPENNPETKINFFWQSDRLESFKLWPFDDSKSCNKSKMAEAGFYWSGTATEPDIATCFACDKVLDGWEKEDDPWGEHQKHAPQCDFVKLGKPEEKLTVSEVYDLIEAISKKMIEKKYQAFKKEATKENEDIRKDFLKHLRS